jgi:hypothetical protein
VSFAAPGQQCARDTTLGTVLSHRPLYDRSGRPNARGRRVLEWFHYA